MKLHVSDLFFIAGIILLFTLCSLVLVICERYPMQEDDTIKNSAIKRRNIWLRSSIIWLCVYYWLILNSILTTVVVLYISCYENMELPEMQVRIFFYSVISLFSSICPYIVNLQEVSKAYRRAYRILDEALVLNKDFTNAIIDGEKIIETFHK